MPSGVHSHLRFLPFRFGAVVALAMVLTGFSVKGFAADVGAYASPSICGTGDPELIVQSGAPHAAVAAEPETGTNLDEEPEFVGPSDTGEMTVPGQKAHSDEELLDDALNLVEAAREFWTRDNEEKSVETLDKAYALILEVDGRKKDLVRQKEDVRLTISKLLTEVYASRHTAAKGNHREIPLTTNTYVQREISSFQGRERRFFLESYRRSGKYRGRIVKALQEAGLPQELSWLPLIESGFKLRARSAARALGLWQFVPATGYKYGLKRNIFVDERLDPVKSTKAAIAYLTDLHEIFGDWATVLAAYNWGEGRILRAINHQKVDYLDGFWDLFERLPYETARYYPRFLAVLCILKDPERYGFALEEPDASADYEEITVGRSLPLGTIAKKIGVPVKDLADLNPGLRRRATPDFPYSLRIPSGTSSLLTGWLEQQQNSVSTRSYVLHSVANGETLSEIALRYHASVQAIMKVNDIGKGEDRQLQLGRKLKIPLDDLSS